jgi:hypothetical protein
MWVKIDVRKSKPLLTIPDKPKSFGYKTYWYAVKTTKTEDVAKAFNLKNTRPVNWEYGLGISLSWGYQYQKHSTSNQVYFVTPPINGWTLVVGAGLPYLINDKSSKAYALFLQLSELFNESHFFESNRSVDYYTWAKAIQGKLIRAYSVGQEEEAFWNEGKKTVAEKELGYELPTWETFFDENITLGWPNEIDVLDIAGEWSVNPAELENYDLPESLGILGEPDSLV